MFFNAISNLYQFLMTYLVAIYALFFVIRVEN